MKCMYISVMAAGILFLLMIFAVPGGFSSPLSTLPLAAIPDSPSVTLRLKKAVFLQHEPITLTLAVVNDTEREIQFWDDAPTFSRLDFQGGSLLSPTATGYPPRSLPIPDPFARELGEIANDDRYWVSLCRLAPGKQWQRTVYLQQFTRPFEPGGYDVTYDVGVPYGPASPELVFNPFVRLPGEKYITTQGNLSFQVKPATSEQMGSMIRAYASVGGAKAKTALCLIDDPMVIPFLVERISFTCWENGVAAALEQFRADKRTKPLLLANLDSPNTGTIAPTLDVLAYLKYNIGKPQLDRLLKSPDESISRAVHRYIKVMDEYHQELN